eukprot:822062-Prymnesium_polylepis.3
MSPVSSGCALYMCKRRSARTETWLTGRHVGCGLICCLRKSPSKMRRPVNGNECLASELLPRSRSSPPATRRRGNALGAHSLLTH